MTPFEVVVVDIPADCRPRFLDVLPLRQVSLFVFEGPEPAFYLDVVCPATLTVHALTNIVVLQEVFVLLTGELAALIRIQNLRLCHAECLLAGLNAGSGVKSVIQLPADNTAAVPVDNGCQKQESVFHLDVGDINRPCLVRPCDIRIAEKVRHNRRSLLALGEVWLWIDWIYRHFRHPAPGLLSSDLISTLLQLCRHLAGSPGGVICVQAVDNALAFQFRIRHSTASIIDACPVDAAEVSCCSDRDRRFLSLRKVSE